ncbi:MAG TPA: biotin-dependent carboxyltransferase family protein [Ilumatobacteraceae bacterium]|nr:biotin-dependent carboxyltransferase family protein [Ilumatobacteraceae bacterium]HRB02419.1 biotin-dependent carboxyltransferase family protein [Ilumatobacteraceae bacterium]
MMYVESWGIAGSVVDHGHAGLAWLGQSRGGAVDVESLSLANRLVGNPQGAAGIETSGGLVVNFGQPTMIVITGAVADVTVGAGPAVGWGSPVALPVGAELRVGRLMDGARVYIAIRGGVRRGRPGSDHELTIGRDPATSAAVQAAPRAALSNRLRVWPGPRLDWVQPDAWESLMASGYEVTGSSRVGVRLHGTALRRSRTEELPSEGVVEGAVQVPPDGQPIIMLADHPTTGGYPVIAVVDPADLRHAAQAAAGTTLRFIAAR